MNQNFKDKAKMGMNGWGVKIESLDRAFGMIPVYFDHPRLPGNTVILHLMEMNPSDMFNDKYELEFSIAVDTRTWKEIDKFDRPEEIDDIIGELVNEFSQDFKQQLLDGEQCFRSTQYTQSALAECSLNQTEIVESKLVSYPLLKRLGSNEGPFIYSLRFVVDNQVVYVEDLYCPNPGCQCNEVILLFSIERWDRNKGQPVFDQGFHVNMGFNGQWSVTKLIGNPRPDSEKYFKAMYRKYPKIHKVFKLRYQQIKSMAVTRLEPHFPGNLPDVPLPGTKKTGTKIGRNEPCPCGSGKKYKKCCSS